MATPETTLVLGADIGGTSTRALIADLTGRIVGRGCGPGANITSHSADDALEAIAGALREALSTVDDPQSVRHAVIGSAGSGNLVRPPTATAFADVWRDAGLRCEYDVVSDGDVAFAAGTVEPDGTLVLCGTGALISRVDKRRQGHTADGHGWLLGDLGSGFWLGREAARTVLRALDRLEPPGPLGLEVLGAVLGPPPDSHGGWTPEHIPRNPADARDLATRMVMAVHSRPPVALSELAPLVTAAVPGDPAATRIVAQAAEHLVDAAAVVRGPAEETPVVLAGSLLSGDTPVRRRVEPRLRERWPDVQITVAADASAGAAWLAAGQVIGLDTAEGAELHARLLPRER